MHPNATSGKVVRDIVTIYDAIIDVLERNYNADSLYRDPIDAPLKHVYKGQPTVILSNPALAVSLESYEKTREPDGAGSEMTLMFKIFCYGAEHRHEPQQDEAIRMAQAVEQILIDNPQLQAVDNTEYVFHAYYEGFKVSFDQMTNNFTESEYVGMDLAIIDFKMIVSEGGY